MNEVDRFQARLEAFPGFLDPKGVRHHEFVKGGHGRKLEFSVIKKDTPEYTTWIRLNKEAIAERHPNPDYLYIIGIARGMIDQAFDVAESFNDPNTIGLKTEKVGRVVRLTAVARLVLKDIVRTQKPTVVILDDAGTTGSSSVGVALECRNMGIDDLEVQYSWQRSPNLEFLDQNGIPYFSLIHKVLPTLSAEFCRAQGDCSRGVDLIGYGQE